MQVTGITIGFPMPVPLLAKPVRAGFPSPADDFIEEEIDLQRLLIVNRPATFLVRVAGDSMILARLFDGDLAIVDCSLTPATATSSWSKSTESAPSRSGNARDHASASTSPTRASPSSSFRTTAFGRVVNRIG